MGREQAHPGHERISILLKPGVQVREGRETRFTRKMNAELYRYYSSAPLAAAGMFQDPCPA